MWLHRQEGCSLQNKSNSERKRMSEGMPQTSTVRLGAGRGALCSTRFSLRMNILPENVLYYLRFKCLNGSEEWAACSKFSLRYIDTWTEICHVGTFAFQPSGVGPVGRSYDVFGDGTLLLVHTPGHSHGLFSVMLRGRDGYIVLGNDAAYLPESFSEHRIPGFTADNRLAEKSLYWLMQCKNDPACMGVFVNHDPTVPEQELEVNL